MNDRTQVRVIEVEYVRADAVDECCIDYVEPFRAAQDRCGWLARGVLDRLEGNLDRRMADGTDRHPEPVEK